MALNNEERQYAVFFLSIGTISCAIVLWLSFLNITAPVPDFGGTFREGIVGQPTSLNPLLAKNSAEKDLVSILFYPLIKITESIELSKEESFWTVRIQEGLKWHDKQPLISDDIIYSIQQIQDPSTNSPLFPYWQGVRVERLSERELKITPPPGFSPLLFRNRIETLMPIPQHIFGSTPPQNWLLSEHNLKSIGSGPYRFEKMVIQKNGFLSSYTLRSFQQSNISHPPYISTIIINFFSEKEEAEEALRFGRIDALAGIDPYEAKSISRPAQTILYKTANYYAIFINQNQNDFLKEKNIREVLNEAVPRQGIVTEVLNNYGTSLIGPVFQPANNQIIDPERKLADIGWIKNNKGKLMTGEDNPKLAPPLEIIVPDLLFLIRTAEIIKKSWEQIGFTVDIKTMPVEKIVTEIIPRRSYQMILFGNIPNPPQDLYPFWHSSQIFSPGLNLSLYKNTALDDKLVEIRSTASSTKQLEAVKVADQIIRDSATAIFLFSPSYVYLTNKDLRGVNSSNSFTVSADRFNNIEEWHLRTKRVFR